MTFFCYPVRCEDVLGEEKSDSAIASQFEQTVQLFRSNIESIRTWQGEATVERIAKPRPGLVPASQKTKIRFFVDIPNNKRLFTSEPIEEIKLVPCPG